MKETDFDSSWGELLFIIWETVIQCLVGRVYLYVFDTEVGLFREEKENRCRCVCVSKRKGI